MQLSIIIVNFNVKYFLEQCLCSVVRACEHIDTEIFVVDNNSTDGSREFFAGRFEGVQFIWSIENGGFSQANNLALQRAKGENMLFLNPDTILPEDCLEKSLAFACEQENFGALGVRMVDGSGAFLKESKRAFPAPLTSLYKLSGLTALFPKSRTFARYHLGHLDPFENHEVDVLAGAFMLIKKEVLDIVGGFDERFFLYGEDVDLSYRIQKAGFRNFYFAQTTIIHFKGESMQKGSLNHVRLFYGAMSLFVKKHYSSGFARFYNVVIRVAIWIKAIIAGTGHALERLLDPGREVSARGMIVVVAKEQDFHQVLSILEKNNVPSRQVERVGGANSSGLVKQITRLRDKEAIFCISDLTAREAIALIEQLPRGMSFKFHCRGTFSIVGSRQKNSFGEYFAIPSLGAIN